MESASLPHGSQAGPARRPRSLLGLARDERLVELVRRGEQAAFEVLYDRYAEGILAFCRHMVGSRHEAEDATQQTFLSAYRDLLRDEREIHFKPWLYTVARNRCVSILRARREEPAELPERGGEPVEEQAGRRAELRDIVRDVRVLPDEQRAALLLSELGDLSHAEIAQALGCEVERVKGLVFRARSGLLERKRARETPCPDIREQLANLRGGSLRRSELRHHLGSCPACREFREDVRRQRRLLAAALPVAPPAWLKASVLAGIGGGSAGGGAAGAGGAAAGVAGAAGGSAGGGGGLGGLAGAAASLASLPAAKLALVGALAGGGLLAGQAAVDPDAGERPPAAASDRAAPESHPPPAVVPPQAFHRRSGGKPAAARSKAAATQERATSEAGAQGVGKARARGPAEVPGSRGHGSEQRNPRADGVPRGRGAPAAPPPQTPVRRGPPEEPLGQKRQGASPLLDLPAREPKE